MLSTTEGRIHIFSHIQMTNSWAVSWRTAVCPQPLQSRQKNATVILNWLAVTLTWWWTLPPLSCNTSNKPTWLIRQQWWDKNCGVVLTKCATVSLIFIKSCDCGSGQTIIGNWIVHNHLWRQSGFAKSTSECTFWHQIKSSCLFPVALPLNPVSW